MHERRQAFAEDHGLALRPIGAMLFESMKPSRRHILKLPLLAAVPYIANAQRSVDPHAIASMFMLGFLGSSPQSASARALTRDLAEQRVGGVCFLGHNTKSRLDIEQLTAMFNDAARDVAPLIAVDQEGGAVQRLGKRIGYESFPRANTVAQENSPDHARQLYRQLALTIKNAGFNLNVSPVIDLGIEPGNPVVYKWGRTFGNDGSTVADYAAAFIEAHRNENILTAAKHFPGHGSTLSDSHASAVDITETWRADELTPYRVLAKQGKLDIVMSGHLSHQQLTAGLPATLSSRAVNILRQELGFSGVLMTDDLDMKAIRSSYSLTEAVLRSIAAGYDLILLSNSLQNDPALPQRMIAAVTEAVREGRLSANSIHESAERLARLKKTIE